MRNDRIDPLTIEQLFQTTPFIGESEHFASSIEMLHHLYLQLKLGSEETLPKVNLETLANSAYYLSALATTPIRKVSLQEQQLLTDAFYIAALIFEYLGDLARQSEAHDDVLENSYLYYLDACICNTLSIYESNSMTIARKRLLSEGTLKEILDGFEPNAVVKLCQSVCYTWLGRDFRTLWWYERKVIRTLDVAVQEVKERATPTIWLEIDFWITLCRALLLHARYFESGNGEFKLSADHVFEDAKKVANEHRNPDYYWTLCALKECAEQMYQNSVWELLEDKLPQTYIRSLVSKMPPTFELWASQRQALISGAESGLVGGYLDDRIRRILVNMPTSAGKSLIAEMAIVKTLFPDKTMEEPLQDVTCVYVAPSIALVNEIERKLNSRLLPLGIRTTAVLGGYDTALFERQLFAQTRVAVLTPEKLSMFLRQDEPFVLNCKLFVFDEVHKVDDASRGWTLEELITWVKDYHPDTHQAKMIFMSAVISNHLQLELWLSQEQNITEIPPIVTINENWRPTRQLKAVCEFDESRDVEEIAGTTSKGRRFNTKHIWAHLNYVASRDDVGQQTSRQIKRIIQTKQTEKEVHHRNNSITWEHDPERSLDQTDHAIRLATKFVTAELDPVFVFFMKREQTSTFCQRLLESPTFSPPRLSPEANNRLNEVCAYISDRLGDDFPLVDYIPKGFAFHHGQLPRDVRAEIEYAFREGWIRVLTSTTTLAEGVNLPITTFILANYKMQLGRNVPWYLEKKDFRNMIGRAGRAIYDTEGQIVFMIPYGSGSTVAVDYLFPDDYDRKQWVLSCFAREDFDDKLLELWLQKTQDEFVFLTSVDPEEWKEKNPNRPGARAVAHSILRLQSFLLLMMDREIIVPGDETTIREFFNRSLLGQQTQVSPGRLELLTAFCTKSVHAIINQEPDTQRRKTYAKSGFAFESSKFLFEVAQHYWINTGHNEYNDPRDHLTRDFLLKLGTVLFDCKELRPKSVRCTRANNSAKVSIPHSDVFADWILNEIDIKGISNRYFGEITDPLWRSEVCVGYIYDTFEYKAPWGISAFNTYINFFAEQDGIEGFEATELGFQLSMLPAYARFGIHSPPAAFFSSLGIASKKLVKLLSRAYLEQNEGKERDFSMMLRWFLSVEPEELHTWYTTNIGEDISGQIARVFRVIRNLRISKFNLRERLPITLYTAGWPFYQGKQIIDRLDVGQALVLEPEPENPHDPGNAIRILAFGKIHIGYVPMAYSAGLMRLLRAGDILTAQITEINPYPMPPKQRIKIRVSLGTE